MRSTLETNIPRYMIHVDREKAQAMGVPLSALFSTMQATFGSTYVNDFTYQGRLWQVNLQAEGEYRVFTRKSAQRFLSAQIRVQWCRVSSLVTAERGFRCPIFLTDSTSMYRRKSWQTLLRVSQLDRPKMRSMR